MDEEHDEQQPFHDLLARGAARLSECAGDLIGSGLAAPTEPGAFVALLLDLANAGGAALSRQLERGVGELPAVRAPRRAVGPHVLAAALCVDDFLGLLAGADPEASRALGATFAAAPPSAGAWLVLVLGDQIGVKYATVAVVAPREPGAPPVAMRYRAEPGPGAAPAAGRSPDGKPS